MSDPLPRDVGAALAHAGLRAVSARHISTLLPRTARRGVYRIELDTRRTIKARCLEDEPTARQLCALRADLPAAFAPVLAQYGRVLLEPWIDGDEVGERLDAGLVQRAGALLAELHAVPPALDHAPYPLGAMAHWWTDVERVVDALRAADALEAQVERALLTLHRHTPRVRRVGLIHTDFCGDNMVVDAQGALHVIDNERIGVGEQGFDLARTWYRWPMPEPAWRQFTAAYRAHGGVIDSEPVQASWRLLALAGAVLIRSRARDHAGAPLERLRALAAEMG